MSHQAPRFGSDEKSHRRLIADAANSALRGELEVTGRVTVVAGTVTTTITDARLGVGRTVLLVPRDQYGPAAGWWLSSIEKGSCVIGHASLAHEAVFDWIVLGTGAAR